MMSDDSREAREQTEVRSLFNRIRYSDLKARQRENFNFQKIAGRLADYGFNCIRLSDDWNGADFIACHIDGETYLRVQLKPRLVVDRKYVGKNIYIAFLNGDDCYVYPHDSIRDLIEKEHRVNNSLSWSEDEKYTWPYLPKWAELLLEPYRIRP